MNEKQLEQLEEKIFDAIKENMKDQLPDIVDEKLEGLVNDKFENLKSTVQQMQFQRNYFGRDMSGLTNKQKVEFAEDVRDFLIEGKTKDLNAQVGSEGGLLVPDSVFSGILRIAETVGVVPSQARRLPMGNNDKISVPRYTGSELTVEYLGVDTEASENTQLENLEDAVLRAETGVLLLVVDERLLRDATADVADWILAMIAEGFASNFDKQALVGNGDPFTGILNDGNVSAVTLASGNTNYSDFDRDKASEAEISIKEAALSGSAFLMHKTVLHELRTKKDNDGNYLVTRPNPMLSTQLSGGVQPQGFLLNRPVFVSKHLPGTSDSASTQTDNAFAIFGNLNELIIGTKGGLRIDESQHASVNSQSSFASFQRVFRAINEHAVVVGNPEGFVKIKTAAS